MYYSHQRKSGKPLFLCFVLIINGRGHSIRCTATAAAQDMCNHSAEGIVSYYGGNDPQDSSGILKHIVIKYAGFGVDLRLKVYVG